MLGTIFAHHRFRYKMIPKENTVVSDRQTISDDEPSIITSGALAPSESELPKTASWWRRDR